MMINKVWLNFTEAMEDILAAEYKRKEKLKQYEIGRAEATRTLLNQ